MRRATADDVAEEVRRTLAAQNVRAPHLQLWFDALIAQLHPDDEVRVVVDYDERSHLISFDAWIRDRRIYGADDFHVG